MDILTLGKMNALSKSTNDALELMANHVYESLQDITEVQAGQVACLEATKDAGITQLREAGGGASVAPHEFLVWNSSHDTAANGGSLCSWTVPEGTKAIKFELQAGGGSGGPSQCCMIGRGGGTGAYATKTLFCSAGDFAEGDTYSICSGGTTPCSCCTCCTGLNACGWRGCDSYVTGPGLSNYCATGGSPGWNRCSTWCYSCFHPAQNGNCVSQVACGCGNFDFQLNGVSGTLHESQYCWNDKYSQPGPGVGPFAVSSATGMDGCRSQQGCCVGHSLFPGGGGYTPYGHSSCCWGGWGASGLVKVTYWVDPGLPV